MTMVTTVVEYELPAGTDREEATRMFAASVPATGRRPACCARTCSTARASAAASISGRP